ncbi:MAG: hypothetical protein ACI9TF_000349 [Paracrocinitomix sp.]|jgi:hypothetical protein
MVANFLINSVVASVLLTVVINLLPRLFPGSSAEDRIREMVGEEPSRGDEGPDQSPSAPAFRIWFPWKQMLVWSMAISLLINVLEFLD